MTVRIALALATLGLASAAVVTDLATGVAPALAQRSGKAKPPKPACDLKGFPLVVGNSWTFVPTAAPAQPPEAMLRFIPPQPQKVKLTVAAIAPGAGGTTVVTLDEDVDGRILHPTITCGSGKFDITPDSILFAAEPGGYFGIELTSWQRKGTTWQVSKGGLVGPEWREDIAATWKRVPSEGIQAELGDGKLEMERRFVIQKKETITKMGSGESWSALGVAIEITGRVILPGVERPAEMPAGWVNWIWLADGVGPVQFRNSYFHQYTVSELTLVK
ncbi:MAG: hypothetical protein KBG28_13295 [Kofleriaceae bacterium]|jgi:hypothetical protein|nr:hypothetical protein [Kofleriaceae bacterium]MBP6840683.1 hypothetical protein [Kofleriaceae bacterium]MBP9204940.1 hypothetical protein [Kofleriaceae bacterium]